MFFLSTLAQVSSGAFIASSPDEKALLESCQRAGYEFLGTSLGGEMRVKSSSFAEAVVFDKLEELEFDSFRKCMSVIVREVETGVIHVLSKVYSVALTGWYTGNWNHFKICCLKDYC